MEKLINRYNFLLFNEFLKYLLEVRHLSENSVYRYKSYLKMLLLWAVDIPLSYAHTIKKSFSIYLHEMSSKSGRAKSGLLALETQRKVIITSRMFFRWAKDYHEKEFKQLPAYWVNDLRPQKISSNQKEHQYVSIDEILKIAALPTDWNDIAYMRDRAAACFLFISGMRGGAFATLPLEAVDLSKMEVYQWPNKYHVHTKNNKQETTTLLTIHELQKVVIEWDEYLRSHVHRSQWATYLWYSPIKNNWGEMTLSLKDPGKNRNQALDKRLRLLFNRAKLEYKSSHKFRHGHAVYGLKRCKTMAEYQAISRNLMHNSIQVTDENYAGIELQERKQLIANLTKYSDDPSIDQVAKILGGLNQQALLKAIKVAAQKLSDV